MDQQFSVYTLLSYTGYSDSPHNTLSLCDFHYLPTLTTAITRLPGEIFIRPEQNNNMYIVFEVVKSCTVDLLLKILTSQNLNCFGMYCNRNNSYYS